MCRLRNIAMRDYQESVTSGQTDRWKDARQSDPYVPLCFATMRDYQESVTTRQTETDREMPDKVIPMCRYASQATQKVVYSWVSNL